MMKIAFIAAAAVAVLTTVPVTTRVKAHGVDVQIGRDRDRYDDRRRNDYLAPSLPEIKKITAKIFSTHTSSNKATPETIFASHPGGMERVKFDFRASPSPWGRLYP